MSKKKTRRSTAAKFLDENKIAAGNNTGWAMPVEIEQIIDEANRRRLAGEHSSATALARVLKAHFDIPISTDTLVKRIKARVGRGTW